MLSFVDVLKAEHRRVRGFGRFGRLRIFRDDRVERRTTLRPLLLEVEEVGHRVFHFVDRGPVVFDDARELELRERRCIPCVDDPFVEVRRERHGFHVARAALALRADGLEVPRHRRFADERRRLVRALELRVVLVLRFREIFVVLRLVVELGTHRVLVARLHREGRLGDVRLIEAALLAVAIANHEIAVERDRFRIVTGVEIVLTEIVHHVERLVVRARRVARNISEEVVRGRRIALQRVDRNHVTTRGVRELRGAGVLREVRSEVDRLLEGVERLVDLALVPENVRELVPSVAVDFRFLRRELDDFRVRLRGEIPFARIALRFIEEQLAECEVRVRDVLRVRFLLDEIVINASRVRQIVRLLVLVREVIEDLVEQSVVRIVVDDERVVVDDLLPRAQHDVIRLVGDRLLLPCGCGVRLLEIVALDFRLSLFAERGALELDVIFSETTCELNAIRRVRGRRSEKIFETRNLRDEQPLRARLQTTLSFVARLRLRRHRRRLLLIAFFQIGRRRRGVKIHGRRFAVLRDVEGGGPFVFARLKRRLGCVADADSVGRRNRRREHHARSENQTENSPNHFTSHTSR